MGGSGASLEVVSGKAAGMTIVVDDELVIGRLADGVGKLAEDEEISRSHARVTMDTAGLCAIEDLGSTNGTFVNGLRVSAPQTLAEGDTIEVGATTMVVRTLPQTEPMPASEPPLGRPQPTVGGPLMPREPEIPALDSPSAAPAVPEAEARVITPTTLSLRLEIDFANHAARVALDDSSEPMRLMFDDGAWRIAHPPSSEKGSSN